jgi:glycine dehydrogenase
MEQHSPICTIRSSARIPRNVKLSNNLNVVTGFAGTTLQPNSGAQGEYAGLMVIRAYHHLAVITVKLLIPSSAHGTNPASAAMAGMKVVVVTKTLKTEISILMIYVKSILHKDNLSCLMVTYPSTWCFESAIKEHN